MFRFAIVEDDREYAEQIRAFLERMQSETGEKFSIEEFSDGDLFISHFQSNFDVILMDIEMPLLDGMSAAQEVRKTDEDVTIIFITNMPQYAIQGYRVGALDYILKPVSYYPFSQTITHALEKRMNKTERYIVAGVRGAKLKLAMSQICYIEVMDHDLTIHTTTENYPAKGTLKEMEQTLEPYHFIQCSKGFLVNLARVDGMDGHDLVVGKEKIPVSRARYKAVLEALNDYMSEV